MQRTKDQLQLLLLLLASRRAVDWLACGGGAKVLRLGSMINRLVLLDYTSIVASIVHHGDSTVAC